MEKVRKIIREVLSEIMDKTDTYTSFLAVKKHADKPNMYLHFTNVYKLGINPQKSHADPHAIYFYPANWIVNEDNWSMFQYAVTMDYYFLTQVDTSNFCHIPSLTTAKISRMMEKAGLYDMWRKYGPDFDRNPPRRFWEFLDMLNVEPAKRDDERHHRIPQVKWNQFWKTTGYDGFSDTQGIVNSDEPNQIAVFNPKTIKIIESGENEDDTSSYNNFYEQIISEYNIDVKQEGYIENGKAYRIYGLSGGKAVDIKIYPNDLIGVIYYSDENGNLYKHQTEYTFETNQARNNIMYAVKNAIENSGGPEVNFDRLSRMKSAAEIMFDKVDERDFKSFGGFNKNPMVFHKKDKNHTDSMFFGGLEYDEKGNLIIKFDFSVSKGILLGEPIEIFTRIVDANPDGNEEAWHKELATYGINPETFEYEGKEDVEAPEFNVNMIVKSPEEALKKVQAGFEKWLASYNWPPANPNATLKYQRKSPEDKVRYWFYEIIKQG